jgi:hypothetical protein
VRKVAVSTFVVEPICRHKCRNTDFSCCLFARRTDRIPWRLHRIHRSSRTKRHESCERHHQPTPPRFVRSCFDPVFPRPSPPPGHKTGNYTTDSFISVPHASHATKICPAHISVLFPLARPPTSGSRSGDTLCRRLTFFVGFGGYQILLGERGGTK